MRRERRPLAGTLVLGPRAGRLCTDLLWTNSIGAGQVALAGSQLTIDNKIFPVFVVFSSFIIIIGYVMEMLLDQLPPVNQQGRFGKTLTSSTVSDCQQGGKLSLFPLETLLSSSVE